MIKKIHFCLWHLSVKCDKSTIIITLLQISLNFFFFILSLSTASFLFILQSRVWSVIDFSSIRCLGRHNNNKKKWLRFVFLSFWVNNFRYGFKTWFQVVFLVFICSPRSTSSKALEFYTWNICIYIFILIWNILKFETIKSSIEIDDVSWCVVGRQC